jgi:UDP-N-acetyl-D-galactosamine dehydrogenase
MNDSMGKYVATEVVKLMMRKNFKVINSKVLILGFTFKEDCPDVRNTRVIDIFYELRNFDIQVEIFDPWVNPVEAENEYGVVINNKLPLSSKYSAIILAVAHKKFQDLILEKIIEDNGVIYDVKGVLPKEIVDSRL